MQAGATRGDDVSVLLFQEIRPGEHMVVQQYISKVTPPTVPPLSLGPRPTFSLNPTHHPLHGSPLLLCPHLIMFLGIYFGWVQV